MTPRRPAAADAPDAPSSSPWILARPRHPQGAAYHVRRLRPGETRDTGIVSATEPGPSRGSLLRTQSLPSLPSTLASSAPASAAGPIPNFKSKSVPNHAHVAQLRAHLDPALILQEIAHGLFDPSGVFAVIGDIIRCHCAPMRDAAVDAMVALARSCGSAGGGTRLDAVRAIRMCFEIMELMKLDVANHQLQTLRPYLVRTAGEYEVQIFSDARHNPRRTVAATREWLAGAWAELERASEAFRGAPRATKVVMAVLVRFAVGWTERNLRAGSPFSALCKRRLRERVEEAVLALVLPHVFGSPASPPTASQAQAATSSGLEPLAAEVKHLSQRAAKLVEIHVSVYGELYAHPAFLDKDRAEDVVLPAVSGSGSGSGPAAAAMQS
ncbi:Tcp11-domain-containing protein [Trametes sanguinea]|nr:Tcp11-domain-containing protein [Trametes sanguinea]